MKTCSYCGRENNDALSDCAGCGTALESAPEPGVKGSSTAAPVPVVIAAVLLIFMSIVATGALLLLLSLPRFRLAMARAGAAPFVYAVSFLGLIITLVCGISLLYRQNWARWLFIGWSLFSIAFSVARQGPSLRLLPSIAFALLITILLTVGSGDYFKESRNKSLQPSNTETQTGAETQPDSKSAEG